jgi:hypothetical protein
VQKRKAVSREGREEEGKPRRERRKAGSGRLRRGEAGNRHGIDQTKDFAPSFFFAFFA